MANFERCVEGKRKRAFVKRINAEGHEALQLALWHSKG